MAKFKLAGYSEKFFEIRKDNIVVEFYQRSMLKSITVLN